ncbi:ribonuclease H-like domain-containing protein [Tanacetum coccineum]
MDLETTQTNVAAKLPLLKQENGNSFRPVPQTTHNTDGTSTTMILGVVTTEEKTKKKNDVKARSFRKMNKPDLDSISFDDLYNNFKIFKQEVKRTTSSNSSSNSQNMAFVLTPSSTNDVNTASVQVSTASSSVSINSTKDSTASPKQIHEDDLEEMDLKWQLTLLSMRERKYYQRTGKKITINGSDTAGYDKSKIKCFNYHKMGHFTRECRNPRNQESRPKSYDNRNRNQDSS